ncbi:MAG: hypothetical protein ACO1O1_02840 [Adhaeribacter sp.]
MQTSTRKAHFTYTYTVLLKNGSQVQVKGRIQPGDQPGELVLVASKDKKKIKPEETLSISRTVSQGQVITGTASQGKWLFPVITGKINGYSIYAQNEASYTTHISQAGSSTLIPFPLQKKKERAASALALRELVKGHAAAEKLLAKHERKIKKKKIAGYTALGGLGLLGFIPLSPVAVVGLPVSFIGAAVAVSVKPVDLVEVIITYNKPDGQDNFSKPMVRSEK